MKKLLLLGLLIPMLSGCFLLFTNLDTFTSDGYEPDDTLGFANTISKTGTPQTHTFHVEGDSDWVTFYGYDYNGGSGYEYRIVVTEVTTSMDVDFKIYDSLGNLITGNINTSDVVTYDFQPTADDTYYIEIYEYGNNETGEYNISVTEM